MSNAIEFVNVKCDDGTEKKGFFGKVKNGLSKAGGFVRKHWKPIFIVASGAGLAIGAGWLITRALADDGDEIIDEAADSLIDEVSDVVEEDVSDVVDEVAEEVTDQYYDIAAKGIEIE